MTFWSWADNHGFLLFLGGFAIVGLLMELIRSLGRRRDVTVRLEGSGVEVVRGSSDGDKPS